MKIKKIISVFVFLVFFGLIYNCRIERELIKPHKKLAAYSIAFYELSAQKYYNLKEYDKAIFQYKKILDKFSDRPRIFQNELAWAEYEIGFCYLIMKDYDNALFHFQNVATKHNYIVSKILAKDRIDEINRILVN